MYYRNNKSPDDYVIFGMGMELADINNGGPDTAKANAALIAAAPEMLKALKGIAAYLESCGGEPEDPEVQAAAHARTVIAKAEGRT